MMRDNNFRERRLKDLQLFENNSFLRLKEFCYKAGFRYSIKWDSYVQGSLCTCELFNFSNGRRNSLTKVTKFLPTNNKFEIFSEISRIVLERLGLSDITISINTSDLNSENAQNDIAKTFGISPELIRIGSEFLKGLDYQDLDNSSREN